MASSNRHWPSMFKSKPCNNQQWPQQHHDVTHHHPSLLSGSCSRSSSTSSPFSSGCEERSPEPKPRWNPKPEQIRILEAIFNSGMVNPPRDEIRRIRAQLQEYGQVGDANVFYWFQNRKSRSKHKQRSLQAAAAAKTTTTHHHGSPPSMAAASSASPSSSTTSSDKASPKRPKSSSTTANTNSTSESNGNNNNINIMGFDHFGINSPNSVNQGSYFNHLAEFVGPESVYFPLHQGGGATPFSTQGMCFGGGDGVATSDHGGFSTLLLGEMIGVGGEGKREDVEKIKFQQELGFLVTDNTPSRVTCTVSSSTVPTPTSGVISGSLGQILGVGKAGGMEGRSTVFVDDMVVEVPAGPFNVKEAFGEDAVLVHPTGHPVITNEWGATLHPLQNSAFYYLVRTTVSSSPLLGKLDTTTDLLAPEFPYQI